MSSDDVIYGWSIIAISGLFLVLYLPLVFIFFVDREFRKSTAYLIMTHIAVTDVLQLFIHLYSGFLVVFQKQPVYWVDKSIGAILTGLWFAMLTFTLFLNYNRISTILLAKFRQANSKRTNAVLFLVCYLSFAVPTIMKLFPDNNYVFVMDILSWGPPPSDGPISFVMRQISNYLILVIVGTSVFAYSAIFAYIGFMRKSHLTRRELAITIQISLVIAYFLFSFFYWNYLPGFVTMQGHVFDYLSMMVWVLMNGIHALIYLIFNERLRKCFFGLVFHGKMPETVSSQHNVLVTRMIAKTIAFRTTSDTP